MIILSNGTLYRNALIHTEVLSIQHRECRAVASCALRGLHHAIEVLSALLLICFLHISALRFNQFHQPITLFRVIRAHAPAILWADNQCRNKPAANLDAISVRDFPIAAYVVPVLIGIIRRTR